MKNIDKIVSIPFFIRICECRKKARDIVDKRKVELIKLVLRY
jgi:hypothetical protein